MSFQGFVPETLKFLMEVRLNNSKEWFEANKKEYNELVLKPFQELVMDLSGTMLEIDPLFEVTPSVNKTISRIYRDTRFSKDKSLYRHNVWITFKRPRKEWTENPAFFFEIFPDSYRYGMGYYSAKRESMDMFRKMIDEKPKRFTDAISFLKKQDVFSIEGDRYKKDIQTKPPEINEWYNRKNLCLIHNSTNIQDIFKPEISIDIANGFTILKPIYNYLCEVEDRKNAELFK